MAKYTFAAGSTSRLASVFIQDSTSVSGAGLTGLTHTSPGLTWTYYRGDESNSNTVTLQNMTLGSWVSGGFKEIDPSGMPGWYQIGIPNAMCADGTFTSGHLRGATNMVELPLEIEIVVNDNQGVSGLKRNVSFTNLPFVMRDETTKLPTTGFTVSVTRLVDGGALGTGGLTNVQDKGSGVYTVDGVSSDVNGTYVTFVATASGADPTIFTIVTIP